MKAALPPPALSEPARRAPAPVPLTACGPATTRLVRTEAAGALAALPRLQGMISRPRLSARPAAVPDPPPALADPALAGAAGHARAPIPARRALGHAATALRGGRKAAGLAALHPGRLLRLAAALGLLAAPAMAQDRIPSHCIGLVQAPGLEVIHRAAFGDPLGKDRVRISFLHHAMFLIETPGGLTAVTDYTGFTGSNGHVPTVVTMNNSHSTHWTPSPDPRIPHVLEGWGTADHPMEHDLELGEMRVRNVHTDARGGWEGGIRRNGNSIFVFETAGLCIGHLGHLHHEPDEAQYAALGRLDVVMVPVDGGYTMNVATMMKVISRLRSSVVLPMHWFSGHSLAIFLDGMKDSFDIVELEQNSIELGLHELPRRPTIIVLQPQLLRGGEPPRRRPAGP